MSYYILKYRWLHNCCIENNKITRLAIDVKKPDHGWLSYVRSHMIDHISIFVNAKNIGTTSCAAGIQGALENIKTVKPWTYFTIKFKIRQTLEIFHHKNSLAEVQILVIHTLEFIHV